MGVSPSADVEAVQAAGAAWKAALDLLLGSVLPAGQADPAGAARSASSGGGLAPGIGHEAAVAAAAVLGVHCRVQQVQLRPALALPPVSVSQVVAYPLLTAVEGGPADGPGPAALLAAVVLFADGAGGSSSGGDGAQVRLSHPRVW